MEKVYQDAKDLNVAARVVYGKAADGKLYLDAELTEQAPAAAVAEAFDKNVLVVKVGDVSFKPVKFDTDTVTVVDVSSGTVTAVEFEALGE